jgi:hypothetical protein
MVPLLVPVEWNVKPKLFKELVDVEEKKNRKPQGKMSSTVVPKH